MHSRSFTEAYNAQKDMKQFCATPRDCMSGGVVMNRVLGMVDMVAESVLRRYMGGLHKGGSILAMPTVVRERTARSGAEAAGTPPD